MCTSSGGGSKFILQHDPQSLFKIRRVHIRVSTRVCAQRLVTKSGAAAVQTDKLHS